VSEGRHFGSPRLTSAQHQDALRRGVSKRLFRTRFIANSVPPPVLRWLIEHEKAVLERKPRPAMPGDVAEWFRGLDTACAPGVDRGVAREGGVEAIPAHPDDYLLHVCIICSEEFEAKRRDAKICSTRCRVAAHRARQAA
jgi:hypothetical protein